MNTFLSRFLFTNPHKYLSRILLVIFLLVASGLTYYIHAKPEEFINVRADEEILNLSGVSSDVIVAADPNSTPQQKQAAQAAISAKKKTTSSTSSSRSGSSTSGSTSSTPSDPDEPESASAFVGFYADNQSDSDEDDVRHAAVVSRLMSSGANPIVSAGDIMEDGAETSWNRFLNIAGTLLGSRTFYAALGNNDRVYGDSSTPSSYFLNYFNFPNNERWYSVNSGNLHIVVLDSAFSSGDANQLSWLVTDLQSADSQSRITVIVFHHPTFASTIESYLQNYGVDFIIAGHIHAYSKSTVGGATVFTLPGGTAVGHATAQIFNDYATVRVYNGSGGLIESSTVSER
ncbi:MAG: metallophosphoesterase [Patescibacteria group bacterium]